MTSSTLTDIKRHQENLWIYGFFFLNCETELKDIGETMDAYCESIGRKTGVKRALISSVHGEDIIILTPVFSWYLEQGLVVDDVGFVISYNPKA